MVPDIVLIRAAEDAQVLKAVHFPRRILCQNRVLASSSWRGREPTDAVFLRVVKDTASVDLAL